MGRAKEIVVKAISAKVANEFIKRRSQAALAHTGEHLATSQEGAFDSTMPLILIDKL